VTRPGRLVVALAGAGALILTACSTSAPEPGTTVTVTRAEPSTATGSAASSGATPSPAAPALTRLPGTCDTMLPLPAIDTALGRAIKGRTAFVVGTAEANIARVSYLNCRYGLPAGAAARTATPIVEIGISLYSTAADAAKRVPVTVDDYANHGASQANATVDGVPVTVLAGGVGAGYSAPTLIAASDEVTIAITVVEKAGAIASKDLTALAHLVLQQLGV
jgi:hypothetical protein